MEMPSNNSMMDAVSDIMKWEMTTRVMDVYPDLGPTSDLPFDVLRQIHIVAMVNLSTSIIVSPTALSNHIHEDL